VVRVSQAWKKIPYSQQIHYLEDLEQMLSLAPTKEAKKNLELVIEQVKGAIDGQAKKRKEF
jgi:hypothetical protein